MKESVNRKWGMITKINKETEEIYHKIAKHYNMSDTCFWIIYILYEEDRSCTQKEICDYWSCTKQTVNSAIKTLEQLKYIQNGCEENGKINKKICLTKKGKIIAEKTVKQVMEMEDKVYKCISEEELDTVIELLKKPLILLKEEARYLFNTKK